MKKNLKRHPHGYPVHQCPHPLWSSHYILSLMSLKAGDAPDFHYRLCLDCTTTILDHLKELCPYETE